MFDFIVFNGSNYSSATAYISINELKEIVEKNVFCNYADINTETDSVLENYIVNASFILNSTFNFSAYKYYGSDQILEFPRSNSNDYSLIDTNIKIATAYIVCAIKNGTVSEIIDTNYTNQVQREKVDVLETSYFELKSNKANNLKNHTFLYNLLKDYLSSNSSFIKVKRA